MSAGNFHGIVNGAGERNGTAAGGTIGPRGPRRAGPAKRVDRAAKPGPELVGFIKTELQARDAAMWPIHAAMWLQPELQLAVPASSGLRSERQHTVPAPNFLREPMLPASRPPSPEKTVHPVLPQVSQQLPASGLAPLGWDPRVDAHGAGKEDQE